MTVDQESIDANRRELGRLLAEYRRAAGYSQAKLAPHTNYCRSTVANVEVGRQNVPRSFWVACDDALTANGVLLAAYDELVFMQWQKHRDDAITIEERRSARLRTGRHDPALDQAEATEAIHRAFSQVFPQTGHLTPGSETSMTVESQDLEESVVAAWRRRLPVGINRSPQLTLVAGFAGSGKTELGRFLSSLTGWALLDKDSISRSLVEHMLISLGSDPNDRQSPVYLDRVRPMEYRCLMESAFENLECGVSTVLAAPFLREVCDLAWMRRVLNRCIAHGVGLAVVWVHCDESSMHEYLQVRGAARDVWKLAKWDDYLASIDLRTRPVCDYYLIDNSLNSAVSLAEQARQVVSKVYA